MALGLYLDTVSKYVISNCFVSFGNNDSRICCWRVRQREPSMQLIVIHIAILKKMFIMFITKYYKIRDLYNKIK